MLAVEQVLALTAGPDGIETLKRIPVAIPKVCKLVGDVTVSVLSGLVETPGSIRLLICCIGELCARQLQSGRSLRLSTSARTRCHWIE